MCKQVMALAAAIVLGALVSVALLDRPASAQAGGGDGSGRIHVVASGNAFIMFDSAGGTFSWVAFPQIGDKKFAWFPMTRLDSEAKAAMWRVGKTDKSD
jgi:hypothetical protein